MAYQMTVTLTDAEYTALAEEAAKSGKSIETILHEMEVESLFHETLAQRLQLSAPAQRSFTRQEIQEYLYREGITENIPTNESDTVEEEAEQERLAALFGQGKPVSEMIIEDRGPY